MLSKENITLSFHCQPKDTYGIFAGAGISFNSGIPMVPMFIKKISENLPLSYYDKQLLNKQKFPFEAFIQRIKTIAPIDELLEVFKLGKPNHTHKLIAKLAKKGVIKIIVTTNFDTLFEQALQKEQVYFERFYKVKELENLKVKPSSLSLIKIHGSIEDISNLGILLERIASKQNISSVKRVLKTFFFNGIYKNVVVLGYSCSDYFDIIPEIERLYKSKKSIFFINHKERPPFTTESLTTIDCFKKFKNGLVSNSNTDSLVLELGKKTTGQRFYKTKTKSRKWETIVNGWAEKNLLNKPGINGLILSGWLMTFIGYYNRALKYYNSARKIALDKTILEKLGKIATYSAQVYRHLGEYEEAHSCFSDALNYWKKCKSRNNYAKTISDIGSTYRVEGKSGKAIKFQKKAIVLFKKEKNILEIQNCLIIIGNSYLNSEKYNLAKRYYLSAKNIFPKISNKQTEAILLNSLGAVYIKLNRLSTANYYLKKAATISDKLGLPRISIAVEYNWGSYYEKKQDYLLAIKKFSTACKLATETNDMYQRLIILKNRSEIYQRIQKYKKALDDVKLTLECIKSNKNLKMKENKSLLLRKRKLLTLIKEQKNS